MRFQTLKYSQKLREDWIAGSLVPRWAEEYAGLLDQDDVRLATTQPRYHFYEWLVAIHYYEQGFQVLIEQYIYARHHRKVEILTQHIGAEGVDFLRSRSKANHAQTPDLFVFNETKRFFAEVKAPRDRFSDNQRRFIEEIEGEFKEEVVLVWLQAER